MLNQQIIMESYWDLLPIELQWIIQELASVKLIQEIFKKNRSWLLLRYKCLKKNYPNFTGKKYRNGDRVLVIKKNNKKTYGIVDSVSYHHNWHCRIYTMDKKQLFYFTDDKHLNDDPETITKVIVLNSWKSCMCNMCKLCDNCVFQGR